VPIGSNFVDTYLAIASKRDQRHYADRDVPREIQDRILDAGRIAGSARNKQPWRFLVIESRDLLDRVAEAVYTPGNLQGARFAVAIVITGTAAVDAGRALQNMMLAAWNEGVTSCPNGIQDPDLIAQILPVDEGERVVNIPTFGYPARPRDPEARLPEEWIGRANRKPCDEVVHRL
jgi:nitroreductase